MKTAEEILTEIEKRIASHEAQRADLAKLDWPGEGSELRSFKIRLNELMQLEKWIKQ